MPASLVTKTTLTKAATALLAYVQKTAQDKKSKGNTLELFDEDEDEVQLVVGLKMQPSALTLKPFPVKLPHSIYGRDGNRVCLFVKDPKEPFAESLAANPVENVTKVISVTELRKNYKQYKDRRALLKEYDHFVCDKRVSALMPSLLGKKFLAKKRQPIAIEINQGQDFSAELKAARDSTAVFVPQSKLTVVRVGTTGFEAKELAANLQAVIAFLSTHKQNGGAANIQGLFIKTKNTLALPLYQALPDNEGEIDSSDSEDADIDTEMKELLGKAVSEMTEQEQEQALNTLLKQTEDPNLVAAPSKKDIRKRAQKRKEADTEAAKKTVVKKRRAN